MIHILFKVLRLIDWCFMPTQQYSSYIMAILKCNDTCSHKYEADIFNYNIPLFFYCFYDNLIYITSLCPKDVKLKKNQYII